jgi:DNA-binding NtrC family response regulator
VERALELKRPLSIAVVQLCEAGKERRVLAEALFAATRTVESVGWTKEDELLILMPEVELQTARMRLFQLVASLHPAAPSVRAGIASCPDHGCDRDTLLGVARRAAAHAKAREVAEPDDRSAELAIGSRSVLILEPSMERLFKLIERLAPTALPVLILGETGSGKENAAFAVHSWSARAQGPFVPVNCAALPETIVESELFGYEKGAFSGAITAKAGLIESASGGTLFLDEIGELSLAVQAKLLRVLESGRLTKLGDVRERALDLRIVAATNRDLEAEVRAGRFRQDLFFRLNSATVVLPPLRERRREIPLLARRFLADACAKSGREPLLISPDVMQRFADYAWPGNVRELKNTMEFVGAAIAEDASEVKMWDLPDRVSGISESNEPDGGGGVTTGFKPIAEELAELEKRRMIEALEAAGGVQKHAAELIHMPHRTFVYKVRQYGLSKKA